MRSAAQIIFSDARRSRRAHRLSGNLPEEMRSQTSSLNFHSRYRDMLTIFRLSRIQDTHQTRTAETATSRSVAELIGNMVSLLGFKRVSSAEHPLVASLVHRL